MDKRAVERTTIMMVTGSDTIMMWKSFAESYRPIDRLVYLE